MAARSKGYLQTLAVFLRPLTPGCRFCAARRWGEPESSGNWVLPAVRRRSCSGGLGRLRALLAREHRELDQPFEALLNALHADARDDALRLWSAFDDGLCRH